MKRLLVKCLIVWSQDGSTPDMPDLRKEDGYVAVDSDGLVLSHAELNGRLPTGATYRGYELSHPDSPTSSKNTVSQKLFVTVMDSGPQGPNPVRDGRQTLRILRRLQLHPS